MASWNFPSNGDGQIKGPADAGIENFNGTELVSLAREICQNSLDAAMDDDNPEVIVEFERYLVDESRIPGLYEYREILKSCKAFWDKSNSEKAKSFLDRAYREAKKSKIYVLRVSDYNTTGLADPYGKKDPFGINFDGWNSLTKIDGGANKGEDKNGNFGIGKNAPFSNSYLRTVFYRTLSEDGEIAAQGISRIVSFPLDSASPKQNLTSGVGYYGNPDGNMPVESISELDALNKRNDVGTDVFIYGFNGPVMEEQWKQEIITAILDSFLMSIYNGQLIVRVQSEELNASTIGRYIEKIYANRPSDLKGTYGNYQALVRKEGVYEFSRDFHGLGTLELKLVIAPNEKLDRKVLIVRKAGMKLFRLGNLSKLVSFSGILELKGKELSAYFRKMETVAHDDWVPGRHPDKKQAKMYYDELKDWIREKIAEIAEYTSDDEMDIEGLGGVLQEESNIIESGEPEEKKEGLNDYLGKIDIIQRPLSSTTKGFFYGNGSSGRNKTEKSKGTLGKDGESGIRILKGQRKRKNTERHRGLPDPEGKDIVTQKISGGETNCPLKNVRIIKRGDGKYTVSFEIPHNVSKGRMELVTVGENGKSNKIRISGTSAISGCSETYMEVDSIGFRDMNAGEKVKINVSLADSHDYAMEVNVYEHNE